MTGPAQSTARSSIQVALMGRRSHHALASQELKEGTGLEVEHSRLNVTLHGMCVSQAVAYHAVPQQQPLAFFFFLNLWKCEAQKFLGDKCLS